MPEAGRVETSTPAKFLEVASTSRGRVPYTANSGRFAGRVGPVLTCEIRVGTLISCASSMKSSQSALGLKASSLERRH